MPSFTKNYITLKYEVIGTGKPIILLHGGAVDFNYNYVQTGWVKYLNSQGYQVIGLNFRGFGGSDSSEDPAFFGLKNFTEDVIHLLEHLKLERVLIAGYSMGTVVTLNLLFHYPEKFSKAVLLATGDGLMGEPPYIFGKLIHNMANMFDFESFPDHLPKHISIYWTFTQELGLNRKTMKAFCLGDYPSLSKEEVSTIQTPTLIVSAENDKVLGKGPNLSKTLRNGEYLDIGDTDHFNLAINEQAKSETAAFLGR